METAKSGHIDRGIDYLLTGIGLCDLLSIAHQMETSPQLPYSERRVIAGQIRQILSSCPPAGRRKNAGRALTGSEAARKIGKHARRTVE